MKGEREVEDWKSHGLNGASEGELAWKAAATIGNEGHVCRQLD